MAEHNIDKNSPLPPGWECRYDHRTGRYYYLNHFTKSTSWEDPRQRYRNLQGTPSHVPNLPECMPQPPSHGSPYHVYPASNSFYPAQAAFQAPPDGSPALSAKIFGSSARPSPPTPRPMSALAARLQETALTSAADTETSVAKISSMFPTANETHIRILLKKYYNREAVVISALQVEKHPITTPGPFATPPLTGRHFQTAMGVVSALQMTPPLGRDTPRTGSPITRIGSPVPRPSSGASGTLYGSPRVGDGYRNSPRPHSSPKMKLRYLKSVFPKADETLLLDVLANADNNVQKASEKLLLMGYEKRDTMPPKLSLRKKEEADKKEKEKKKAHPTPPPRIKSLEEKNKMKARLQAKYVDIPDRVITMALESVDYSEDRAGQILNIVIQEEEAKPRGSQDSTPNRSDRSGSEDSREEPALVAEVPPPQEPPKPEPTKIEPTFFQTRQVRRTKAKTDSVKIIQTPSPSGDQYRSAILCGANGPNIQLLKGPNDDLLLVDYVTWNGADPDILTGRSGVARGPDASLRSERGYTPRGANANLCKGPMAGLAKGSMYGQLNARPIAVGDSRYN